MSKPQPLPSPDPPALPVSAVQPGVPDRKYELDYSWVCTCIFSPHVVILGIEVATSLLQSGLVCGSLPAVFRKYLRCRVVVFAF